jgi:choline-sulfatase
MARRGRYKYIHIHEMDAQLFDLASDPGEWRNLAGDPQHQEIETALRDAILTRFNTDAIEADVRRSLRARQLIRPAMRQNGTLWDYAPTFDPNRDALAQYLPASSPGQAGPAASARQATAR